VPTFDALGDFVRLLSEAELSARIVAALRGANFGPVRMLDEPTWSVQLCGVHGALNDRDRTRFRSAVVRALREWVIGDESAVLESLVLLSAYVSATDAIPYLWRQIEAYAELAKREGGDQEALLELMESTLSALHAFAPDPEVRQLLLRLYSGEVLLPEFCGQLFVALCECDPVGYPRYIARFLHWVTHAPDQFPRLDLLLGRFMDVVTADLFFEQFTSVPPSLQAPLLELVQRPELGVLAVKHHEGDWMEVWRPPDGTPTHVRPAREVIAQAVDLRCEAVEEGEAGAVGCAERALAGVGNEY
jgi:hypothetical protein